MLQYRSQVYKINQNPHH